MLLVALAFAQDTPDDVVMSDATFQAYVVDRKLAKECMETSAAQSAAIVEANTRAAKAHETVRAEVQPMLDAAEALELALAEATKREARMRSQRNALVLGGAGLVVGLVVGGFVAR